MFRSVIRNNAGLALFKRSIYTVRTKKNKPVHYALIVCPVTAFGLCIWQYKRMYWKLDLLEQMNNRIPQPPVELSKEIRASTDIPEFTPVTVTGKFDHSREMLIGLRSLVTDLIPKKGYGSEFSSDPSDFNLSLTPAKRVSTPKRPMPSGYYVVTPFRLTGSNDWILVNRGWVPTDYRDPSTRPHGQIPGEISMTGYIRYHEKPPYLSPSPVPLTLRENPNARQVQFFARDIERMSKLADTMPLMIDAAHDSSVRGGPVGGQTRINLRNEHFTYMLTWGSLGTITLLMWIRFLL